MYLFVNQNEKKYKKKIVFFKMCQVDSLIYLYLAAETDSAGLVRTSFLAVKGTNRGE